MISDRYVEPRPMRISIPDDIVFRELSGEGVILNLSTGIYFGLDEVGTRMWQLIAEHGEKDRIVDVLLKEYAVERSQLAADLDQLLRTLADKGLVRTDAEKTPAAG
jgi:hypothetical protein